MKKFLLIILTSLFSFFYSFADEYVNGYYKQNGTYVNGYYRSEKNNTVRDNFSYYNNTNPYTKQKGTNKYRNNPTSGYYKTNNIYNTNSINYQNNTYNTIYETSNSFSY